MKKKVVHLDLKGAPLRIPYLEKVLIVIKSWGATGILIEWEDTFPYKGVLEEVGSANGKEGMYTDAEVRHILTFAKRHGLEAIQLIQTIGHLEFVLKHPQFKHLREAPASPAVLCPSKPYSQVLVKMMLEQALDLQPDANYLHMGADEVWHMEFCPDCKLRSMQNSYQSASLYLEHIKDLVLHIKRKKPDLTILIWDDMLRAFTLETLRAYKIGLLVQPVLWQYNPTDYFQIDPNLWNNYRIVFGEVWAGSAFKGANGSCQIVSPVSRYVSNHEAWVEEYKRYRHEVNFAGVILTGWSRYDHYATLCELMPVSLPSLSSCLNILQRDDKPPDQILVSEVLPSYEWPGEEFARCAHSFIALRDRCLNFIHGDLVTTWMNPWQVRRAFTNPIQLESIAITAGQLFREMTSLHTELSRHLTEITGIRSKDEWLETFVTPILKKVTKLYNTSDLRSKMEPSLYP